MYHSIPDSNHLTWRERDRPTDASPAIGEARRSPPAAKFPCRSSRHDVRSTHAPQDGAVLQGGRHWRGRCGFDLLLDRCRAELMLRAYGAIARRPSMRTIYGKSSAVAHKRLRTAMPLLPELAAVLGRSPPLLAGRAVAGCSDGRL